MKTTGLSLAVALLAMAGLTTTVQAQEQRSAKVAQCMGL
jgi:hypothetical protein